MVTDLVELVRSLEREDGLVPAEELLQAAAGLPDRKAAWEAERREFLLKEVFWKAGAREAEYLAYRYRKEAVFGEDGALLNGEELVLKAKEELPEFFARRQAYGRQAPGRQEQRIREAEPGGDELCRAGGAVLPG